MLIERECVPRPHSFHFPRKNGERTKYLMKKVTHTHCLAFYGDSGVETPVYYPQVVFGEHFTHSLLLSKRKLKQLTYLISLYMLKNNTEQNALFIFIFLSFLNCLCIEGDSEFDLFNMHKHNSLKKILFVCNTFHARFY